MNHRIEKLQQELQKRHVDGALYATSAALQYLLDDTTYYWQRTIHTGGPKRHELFGLNGHTMNVPDAVLFVPAKGEATLVMTEERAKTMNPQDVNTKVGFFYDMGEMVSDLLPGTDLLVGESCSWFIKDMILEHKPSCNFADGEEIIENFRKIKEPKEVEALRKVAAYTDHAMERLTAMIKPGITQLDLQHAISQFAREDGIDISFPPAAIFTETDGPDSEKLWSYPLAAPMHEGMSVGFDFGYLMNGYVSDYGRSLYLGQAPEELEKGYEALQRAQQKLIADIRPGMRIGDCFKRLYDEMDTNGYGKYLRRSPEDIAVMGHQIGIDTHERPWIHDLQDAVFETGMVMCIEPKLWWPGKCYLRCEDMVHITEDGAEFLTQFDRSCFSLKA